MVEWPLFSYCWIGIMGQLIANDLLVGHPGDQLGFTALMVALLTAVVAHRRGVSDPREWCWLTAGTVTNWLFLLPVGGLGSTISVEALLPLPTPLLRILILDRWKIIPVLVVIWLLLGGWWLRRGRRFVLERTGGWLKGVPWDGKRALAMVALTTGFICSGILVQHYGADLLAASWWLLVVTILLSYWLTVIVKWFWQLPDEKGDSWLTSLPVRVLSAGLAIALGAVIINQQEATAIINHPLVISHRGVNGNNGVPNTIQSLSSTAKGHPERVETDVQLTKNDRFLTFHDGNLRQMTGRRGTVHQYTLAQLARQTAVADDYQTKLTPFSTYLRYANHHRVPLLVELKPQKGVAPATTVKYFQQQYGLGVHQPRFWLHSVDIKIVTIVQKRQPNAKIGIIFPYVVSQLPLNGDFYCINYHMLNRNLVETLHRHHKKVYAWTVDRPADAYRMKQLGVDGIITNNYEKVLEISRNNKYILSNQVVGKLFELF
ncbi:glycerophosphodiester phosphodiesterase family protein [uncultured Limosilactobacillus sp.]|uniref:glycerophosphodiester phosphodiesterase family protein n=1 Tax=uncultured Limosilactobacillus sp. TaxID=2837629 RepID=UPI0025D379BC|nr:glycerophosphodiester phosphodiesterase family protein [uncultured Limosilactobacillus sp.]